MSLEGPHNVPDTDYGTPKVIILGDSGLVVYRSAMFQKAISLILYHTESERLL